MPAFNIGPFVRVVNVSWAGGAIFIIVGHNDVYYYRVASKTAEPDQRKLTMPDSPVGPVFPFLATSYKLISGKPPKPTFLVSGQVFNDTGDELKTLSAAILTSKNGIDWYHTFLSEQGFDIDRGDRKLWASSTNALVWSKNGNAFFHDQRMVKPGLQGVHTPTGVNTWVHEQVYRSLNGEIWDGSPVSDEQVWYGAETMGYRSEFPPIYCAHNDCKDTLGQNVPDGFMHDDTARKILMRPKTPATIYYGVPDITDSASNVVQKVVEGKPVIELTVRSLSDVSCIAGANGIWVAGGSDGAAISFDDGQTWTKITFVDDTVMGISAAPSQDIA